MDRTQKRILGGIPATPVNPIGEVGSSPDSNRSVGSPWPRFGRATPGCMGRWRSEGGSRSGRRCFWSWGC